MDDRTDVVVEESAPAADPVRRRMPLWSKLGVLVGVLWALAGMTLYALGEADIWRPAVTPVVYFFEVNVTPPPPGIDTEIAAARKEYDDYKALVDMRAGAPESLKEKGLQDVRLGKMEDAEMISNLILQIRELEMDYKPELDALKKKLDEKEAVVARSRENAELLALLTHAGGGAMLMILFLVSGMAMRNQV